MAQIDDILFEPCMGGEVEGPPQLKSDAELVLVSSTKALAGVVLPQKLAADVGTVTRASGK